MIKGKVTLSRETEEILIFHAEESGVYIEGNLLKALHSLNRDFCEYLDKAIASDTDKRKKRLEVTKQVQQQNRDLEIKAGENEKLMDDLKVALRAAEDAKQAAINDLDVMQKKSQFQLIGNIVTYALYVIVGTGLITTAMYVMSILFESPETTLIGNTWSNLFGILLTNSFSIIGTIMGVKYANGSNDGESHG